MEKDLRMPLPTVTAEIKLSVVPDRAAVFVDGLFAGHVVLGIVITKGGCRELGPDKRKMESDEGGCQETMG
jgi:hypothetical protein